MSKPALIRAFVKLRDRLSIPGFKQLSGESILEYLTQSELLHVVPVKYPNTEKSIDKFFSIGLDSTTHNLDPVELLQAIVPNGVICYFTAIYYYNLTTQIPTHHHIARITNVSSKISKRSPRDARGLESVGSPFRQVDPLGVLQFYYQGFPYYVTTREKRLLPGVQNRFYTDKTIFNITTLEQTLLDSLHRPYSCGGPPVVFEAWESATPKLDEQRLMQYLRIIDDQRLNRRVGFLLTKYLDYEPGDELNDLLEQIKYRIINNDSVEIVSLLPGFKYLETDREWHLEVP